MSPALRSLLAALAALAFGAATAQGPAPEPAGRKVLHLAFRSAESSLDPAKVSDLYSRTVTPHIFEALYQYDHLARPIKVKPLVAAAMPDVSPDYRTWTVKVRPGIYFQADPAFKGARREVVAQDFVYPFQRIADPANKSPLWGWIDTYKIVGLAEARKAAIDSKKPFDYDAPIEGVRALDRYTLQIRVTDPRPRLINGLFVGSDLLGAQAREVVEFYGEKIDQHPVGTGPFRLKQWRRSSLIVLERNPDYRERLYDAEPAPDDAEGQALLARFKGRRLPMVDEVRVSIVPEAQPFWLAFLNGQTDILGSSAGSLPGEFVSQAMPNGKLAPNLAKRGIRAMRQVNSDTGFIMFNMEDPVVGGYTPDKVALRRAISLAYDNERDIRLLRRGQAIPAQSNIVPHTTGYDPAYKSEMSDYSPPRANALLDLFGYVDRDGDGWRELPDGKPLVIQMASQPDDLTRKYDELWKKSLKAVGIRIEFKPAQWPENLKAARAGKIQFWQLGSSAAGSDGQGALARLFGPQAANQNLARFRNPEFDRIYERMRVIPDGPEREQLFLRAKQIAVAFMPYRHTAHRMEADMLHAWVDGYRRPLFWQEWWHMVDIDADKRRQMGPAA